MEPTHHEPEAEELLEEGEPDEDDDDLWQDEDDAGYGDEG
jgi:hypothetical protein